MSTNDKDTVIHPRLSKCYNCYKASCKIDVEITQHPQFEHCKTLKCRTCKNIWYICVECTKRFSHSNKTRMYNHYANSHSTCEKITTIDCTNVHEPSFHQDVHDTTIYDDGSDISETYIAQQVLTPDEISIDCFLSNINNDKSVCNNNKKRKSNNGNTQHSILANQHFERKSSKFINDEKENPGNGMCGLITTAFQQSHFNDSKATLDESIFHLNATHFCSQLTEVQQIQFSSILQNIVTKNFSSTKVPTSLSDIRKHYTTGKFSVYQNLPTPKVEQLDNHAWVSIESTLDHALGIGIELNLFRSSYYKHMAIDNSDLYHIQRSRKIFEECYSNNKAVCDPYVILLILWSDDFEVNHTRKNRNSTWLKTLTIVPPQNMNTSRKHTHAICLGRKNQDHSFVNKMFQKEIEKLCEPKERYIHQLKQHVPTVARVLVMSCDRPERCSLNNVLNYTGNSTRRWLYSSLVNPFRIASCNRCLKKDQKFFSITNRGA